MLHQPREPVEGGCRLFFNARAWIWPHPEGSTSAATSAYGTKRRKTMSALMSAMRGKPDSLCSLRVFRSLTPSRHGSQDLPSVTEDFAEVSRGSLGLDARELDHLRPL